MTEQPVSLRECARQLHVNVSTISRHVASGLIPNRAPDGAKRPIVFVSEARRARERGVDPSKQRGDDDLFQAPAARKTSGGEGFNQAKTAKTQYEAAHAALDWAEAAKLVCAVADVESEQRSAARRIRDRLLRLPREIAGQLAAQPDERECRSILKTEIEKVLSEIADEIAAGDNAELLAAE